ncbi:MAG: phosphate ABC transporter substrate-binding/OmpA family protein, partial [Candidatus Aenigmatarchaeota archaeon]
GFKVFLGLVLAVAVVGTLYYFNRKGAFDDLKQSNDRGNSYSTTPDYTPSSSGANAQPAKVSNESITGSSNRPLNVMTVPYPGGGPMIWANNGFNANKNCFFYNKFGIQIQIHPYDVSTSVPALISGELDFIINTIDVLPTLLEELKEYELKVPMITDVSRGGDQWVVPPEIQSIEDLKGRKVAVSVPSPSYSLGLYGLDYHGKPLNFVKWSPQLNPEMCRKAMEAGRVDGGALVWSPDHFALMDNIPGSHVIYSTTEANQLIRNVFVCKLELIEERGEDVFAFIEGWFTAVHELKTNKNAWSQMCNLLSTEFGGIGLPWSAGDWELALGDFYLSTYGDNLRYYGIVPHPGVPTAQDIYDQFNDIYTRTGDIRRQAIPWNQIGDSRFIQKLRSKNWRGEGWDAEPMTEFAEAPPEMKTQQSFAFKPVSVTFATNSHALDNMAKNVLDRSVVDPLRKMGGAYCRIEGHTDSDGKWDYNMWLSEQRAFAVRDYLVSSYEFDPNRFICVGHGPDKPAADNSTSAGKRKNRRTEFHLLSSGN